MCVWGGLFEVCGECEGCEGEEDALVFCRLVLLFRRGKGERRVFTYHCYPDMYPPTREETIHHRSLRRERVRVSFRFARFYLLC